MSEAILRGKVAVLLATELWTVVCVTDTGYAEPDKVGFGFADDSCC